MGRARGLGARILSRGGPEAEALRTRGGSASLLLVLGLLRWARGPGLGERVGGTPPGAERGRPVSLWPGVTGAVPWLSGESTWHPPSHDPGCPLLPGPGREAEGGSPASAPECVTVALYRTPLTLCPCVTCT